MPLFIYPLPFFPHRKLLLVVGERFADKIGNTREEEAIYGRTAFSEYWQTIILSILCFKNWFKFTLVTSDKYKTTNKSASILTPITYSDDAHILYNVNLALPFGKKAPNGNSYKRKQRNHT